MSEKLRVGILGATGMVGQRFISLLENHPWFEVTTIAASPRSAGKRYEDAIGDRWKMTTPMPEAVKDIVVMNVNEVEKVASEVDFVFSAVDMTKDEIKAIEEAYAKTETPVVSNNSAHRWTPDVPMVVPEINADHFEVIKDQKKRLGTTRGFIAVKPNCSIQSYAPCLAAWKEFGPKELVVTTYQAISGAGKTFKDWPEMVGNIIPYIGGEEEKPNHFRPVFERFSCSGNCLISSCNHFIRFKFFPCCQYRCITLDRAVWFYCYETSCCSKTFFLEFDDIKVLWIDFRNYHRNIRCPSVCTVVGYNRCLCLSVFFLDLFDLFFCHVYC